MEESNYNQINEIEKNNWWYRGKRDLFNIILKNLTKKRKNEFLSALDIGCGVGSNLKILKKYSDHVEGIDFSKKAINYCLKNGHSNVRQGDIHNLNLKKRFDLVLCSDILEHVDDKRAIENINKILKPGGIFIFSVPAHKYLWNDNDYLSHHKRRYEKKQLRLLLKQNFKILKLSYWNSTIFFPTLLIYNLQKLKKQRKATNNLNLIPDFLNNILFKILKLENQLLMHTSFLQGISIIGICQKRL